MMADPLIYEKLNILTGKSQMDYFQNYHNGVAYEVPKDPKISKPTVTCEVSENQNISKPIKYICDMCGEEFRKKKFWKTHSEEICEFKASLKKLDTKSKRDLEAEKDKGIWTGERFEEYMKKILEPIKVISDNLSNIPFS
uniref:C2H2-type domain-containing protein n=1 Tax=Caenorhabditis tropicalis TaxID=1561998 RepID=A0A1I7UDS5_9PELO